jgi:hypothetical protein
MAEAKVIKFTTFHLDGESHEWWYHGLVTLGHATITSYLDFTHKLMESFDKKDPKLHFKDLAQIKKEGTSDAYIIEFQRLAVTVIDISKLRLVMLFIEGISKPLCGWVKDFNPETLHDVIVKEQDMEGVVPKKKTLSKPFIPQKVKYKKPPVKEGMGKERLDEVNQNVLRKKNLCFNCKYPWAPGHRCIGKGKVQYIEMHSYSDEEEEDASDKGNE